MDEPAAPPPRIGNAEREAAQHALDAHLQAGRLDAEEYGERSAQASVARTAADLTPLFADLPEPNPTLHPGAGAPAVGPAAGTPAARPAPAPMTGASSSGAASSGVSSSGGVPARADGGGSALERIGPGVMAALPLIALVLFFVVPIANSWVFFLLIPIGGIVFAGSRGRRRDRDGRDGYDG